MNDSSPFSTRYAPFILKTLDMTASCRQVLQAMLSIASAALVLPPQEVLGPESWDRLALDTAELLSTEDGFGVDPYATGLNLSRLAGYKGVCYVRLQQPDRALPALQQAVDLLPPSAIRRQLTLLTDMATAYVQQGAIEQACKLAGQAATLTVETRSRSVLHSLGAMFDGNRSLAGHLD